MIKGTASQVSQGNGSLTTTWIWRINTGDPPALTHPLYAMSEALAIGGVDPTTPTVNVGPDMITWSDELVPMDPDVDNNGGTSLEYAWVAETTDPNVAIVLSPNSGDPLASSDPAPTVTITKIDSGGSVTVKVTLTVNNQGSTNFKSDFMFIDVYDDACAAANAFSPMTYDKGDINQDCITNLKDLAEMALTWLNDYRLSGPVVKP